MSLNIKENMHELLEIEDLVKLIGNSINYNSEHFDSYLNWEKKIETLREQIEKSHPSEINKSIDELTLELRVIWLKHVQSITNSHFKSPPLHTTKRLPMGNSIDFSYERNIQPSELEEKAKLYRGDFLNWNQDSVIYSSGMAAISSFFQSYFAMYKPSSSNVLKVSAWSDYFETRVLTDLYRKESIQINSYSSFTEFQGEIEETDIFFIEPVRYNWDLEVFEMDSFIEKVISFPINKLKILIIDTTLNSSVMQIGEILKKIKNYPYIILVVINSLLKLDQQGLEFSNGGLVTLYTNTSSDEVPKAHDIADYMRKVRTILGTGLTYEEIGLLTNTFVFNKEMYEVYCKEVYENNSYLASKIPVDGIFAKVVHPSLFSDKEWAQAPFIVIHLKEDNLENHGLLLAVIRELVQKKDVSFDHGSSFGFRNHRYEAIIPNVSEGKGLFKIAMGKRKGKSLEIVQEIVEEVAGYKNFESLKNSYPMIKPVAMDIT